MKLNYCIAAVLVTSGLPSASFAAVETYTIDPVHSSVAFSVRHFVAKVPGRFSGFSGTISVDRDKPANNSAEATINVTSIDTGTKKRDDHLRSADFFDAAQFPSITFKSKSWRKTGEATFAVIGNLTIKDVTKEVTLDVTSLGFGPGADGKTLSGWEAATKINKKEFNVKDPPMLDAALGDDVTITINIEAKAG